MHAICEKCRKRRTCTTLCKPVELYVNQSGRLDHEEKYQTDSLMLFHRKKEIPISTILSGTDLDKLRINEILSDSNVFPFSEFTPKCQQTKIFILKLYGHSYKDIAAFFDMTPHQIMKIFNTSKKRFLTALELFDNRRKIAAQAEQIIKRNEAKSGKMPKMKKQFILAKVFDLTPKEIGEMVGVATSTIMSNLKYYSKKHPDIML